MRNNTKTQRFIGASALALAIASLAACGKNEAPMETPPAAAPMATPAPAATAPAQSPSTSASGPSTTMGEKVDDTVITTKVKTALLADDVVKGLDISVNTTMGAVALTGAVENQMQIDRAVELAKAVEGVQNVQNGMTLKN
jgi:hyperosmotically inducible protein